MLCFISDDAITQLLEVFIIFYENVGGKGILEEDELEIEVGKEEKS
jgi:hypothetical protein